MVKKIRKIIYVPFTPMTKLKKMSCGNLKKHRKDLQKIFDDIRQKSPLEERGTLLRVARKEIGKSSKQIKKRCKR